MTDTRREGLVEALRRAADRHALTCGFTEEANADARLLHEHAADLEALRGFIREAAEGRLEIMLSDEYKALDRIASRLTHGEERDDG